MGNQDKSKKILFISSLSPVAGPGSIGLRMYNLLKAEGVQVDMLTLYQVPELPEVRYIFKSGGAFDRIKIQLISYSNAALKRLAFSSLKDGYGFFYGLEKFPPVPSTELLRKIDKPYDLVIVYFWQELLSFKTINDIYDKLHCKFLFICADFSTMSGGCHFPNNCQRFKSGCGCCPAIGSNNPHDFSYKNVLYRQKVYEKVKPVLWLNTYMRDFFYSKAFLTHDAQMQLTPDCTDLTFLRPLPAEPLRPKYGIPERKRFVIAFGFQILTEERKGISYIIKALNLVYDSMTDDEREKTLIIAIGRDGESLNEKFKLDYKYLGYIPLAQLPEFYSIASVFVGASIYDAGPSTYVQTIACGTPLVAFEMGAALDVLRGKDTGYCAKLRDSADLAKGVLSILRMAPDEYINLRQRCAGLLRAAGPNGAFAKSVLSLID